MTIDIETRLRADARRRDREDAAPPRLDALLDVATQTSNPRGRRGAWLAAVAATVAVVAGAGLLASTSSTAPQAGRSDAPSVMPVIAGATVTYQNPRELVVFVKVIEPVVPCATQDATLAIVSQTSKSVVIDVARGFTRRSDSDPLNCELGRYEVLDLHLKAPLTRRSVVDASSGTTIPVVADAAPQPSYLPTGYTPASVDDSTSVYTPANGRTEHTRAGFALDYSLGSGNLVPPAATRVFLDAAHPNTNAQARIITGPSATLIPGDRTIAHASVGGHDATLTGDAHQRCLTWSETSARAVQVCSNVGYSPGRHPSNSQPLLSAAQLLKIARSLP